MEETKERCREDQPGESTRDTQDAAAESGGEIGLQHDRDGHRNPVGALQAERATRRVADTQTNRQPQRVPERGRTEREIRLKFGEPSGKAQPPWLTRFFGIARPRNRAQRGSELSAQRIDLLPGVADQRREKRRGGTMIMPVEFMRRPSE